MQKEKREYTKEELKAFWWRQFETLFAVLMASLFIGFLASEIPAILAVIFGLIWGLMLGFCARPIEFIGGGVSAVIVIALGFLVFDQKHIGGLVFVFFATGMMLSIIFVRVMYYKYKLRMRDQNQEPQ